MTQLNGLEVVGMKLEISFATGDALKMRQDGGEMRTARFEDGMRIFLLYRNGGLNNFFEKAVTVEW